MVVDLKVERIVGGGDGIATLDGLKVFVRQSAPQEQVRARIVARKRDYATAEVVRIIEPSPLRVEPPCRYYGSCGGCQLQHISHEGQLAIKKSLIDDALQRIGHVSIPAKDFAGAPQPWHYRNKTQFPVGTDGQPRIGFYRRRTHDVIDVDECLLHVMEFDSLRAQVRAALLASGESAYDERTHTGNIRHLILRQGEPGGPALIIVVTRTPDVAPQFVDSVIGLTGAAGFVHNTNATRTNRILGRRSVLLAGVTSTAFRLLDRRFRVSASSFFQVNSGQALRLCDLVLKHVAPQGTETIADLFCGVGLLSLVLAPRVRRVIGVEMDAGAVEDAMFNAYSQGADNVEFRCEDVDRAISKLDGVDVVVLDPPRKGCCPATLRRIAEIQPHRVIYVSCNPATLARDIAILSRLGYATRDVEPVDMFPQTCHVEVIAHLVRS